MALRWTRRGADSECEDADTGLRLLVAKDGVRYDFNGHKFATEAEVRAYVEAYAVSAIARHGLSATNRAN